MCFINTDLVIKNSYSSYEEILDNFGSKYFDKIEKETLKTVETSENSVIVTSTESIFSQENIDIVKKHSLIIYFQINFKVFKKIKNVDATDINKTRLIMNEIVFSERDKLYCQNADIVVDASSLKIKKVLKNAIKAIKNYFKKLK